jgi:alpha-glucosidase
MIINTELENKGDLFPSKITSYEHEVDSIIFNTDNNVILKVTILRDSLVRFRYTSYFSNDFSTQHKHTHGYNALVESEYKITRF